MKIEFTVPGVLKPKERPRRAKNGHFYTPTKTGNSEETVRMFALRAMALCGWPRMYAYPVIARVSAYYDDHRHRDVDNIVKTALDAVNGLVLADDRQVVELHAYLGESPEPRVEISFETIEKCG